MNEYRPILLSLAGRLLLAALLIVGGWLLLGRQLLLAPVLILIGAFVVARPIASLVGETTTSLFYPNTHFDRPQPIYGIPEARAKEGRYEEALEGYEAIVREHPHEVRAWAGLIEVAGGRLHDPLRAHRYFEHGLAALRSAESRTALSNVYEALQSTWKKT